MNVLIITSKIPEMTVQHEPWEQFLQNRPRTFFFFFFFFKMKRFVVVHFNIFYHFNLKSACILTPKAERFAEEAFEIIQLRN